MRILITGVTGFVGGHLVEHLAPGGHTLFGLCRRGAWPQALAHLAVRAELLPGEIADGGRVEAVLNHARPDCVVHLAGYANPRRSFEEPDQCCRDNLPATRSLYDAVVRPGPRPRLLYVSTRLIY